MRGPLPQAFISAVFYTLLGLSTSIYLGKITDHVFVSGNRGLLNLMSLVMLALIACMLSLSLMRNLLMLKSGQVIDNRLILSYYRQLLRLPQRFFDSMKTGEIISRINDAVKIRSFINDAAVGLVVNALILAFSFLFLFLIDLQLGLVMALMLPLYALVYGIYNRQNRRMERRVMEEAARLEDHLVESIASARHLRQFNLEDEAGRKGESGLNRLLDRIYRSGLNGIGASTASEGLNRIFTIILLWFGSSRVIGDMLTAGQLLSCYALMGYLTGPVGSLLGANRTYQNARIAADRLFEIFDLEVEEPEERPHFPRENFGRVEFRDVAFAYGSRGMVLHGVSLEILPGTITVISGESGSGKSTLAALLGHLYRPDRGQVLIRGCDTRDYSCKSLRALCGVVPQEARFLAGTLLENLVNGDPEPDLFRISALLERTGLSTMVGHLPGGLGTEVKQQGANFSGGERQRLALVRALYTDPPLLVLDEPGSALDRDSERLVNRLILEEREKGKSILMITHKKTGLVMADRLYRMEKGQVHALPPEYGDPFPAPSPVVRMRSGPPEGVPESSSADWPRGV